MPVSALLIRLAWPALLLLGAAGLTQAQRPELPRCGDRPTIIRGELFTDNRRWCAESVIHHPEIETYSFTALEAAPDGTLYATRPVSGQVMRIVDTDGDTLPDTMEHFVDGLTRPNGLAYHEGELYIAGGAHIYSAKAGGEVTTIVDDLPTGTGFWTGGLAIGPDERLIVALGAPCDNCRHDEPERGAIVSMDLDGGGRQTVASGFRYPADVALFRGQLWTLDSAPRQDQRNALDELNRVQSGAWYGFPHCLGADTLNLGAEASDCAAGIAPAMSFGSGAVPSSLAAYPFDPLPGTADTLIAVLSGDPSQTDIVGYKVIMITFDAEDQPLGATALIPYRLESKRAAYLPYRGEGLYWERFIHVNEIGFGFYPQQPLAVAVSPQGWIYISITGGRIIALRPRNREDIAAESYPLWTPMNPNFDPSALPPRTED